MASLQPRNPSWSPLWLALLLPLAVHAQTPGRESPPPAAAPKGPAAAEPAVVEVGNPVVDGSFIQPLKNKWRMIEQRSDGTTRDGGTWSDEVVIEERDGRSVLRRTQVETRPNGRSGTYVNVVDRKTLAPIASEFSGSRGLSRRTEFDRAGTHVKWAQTVPGGTKEEKSYTLDRPVFDFNGGMYGMLIVGFPLKEGYSAKFPTLDDDGKVAWITFRVTGRAEVPAGPGKKVTAWVVEADSPATAEHMTFSLTKEAPYVIRLEQKMAGSAWTFDMM
jgi:hypothetical protein